MLPNFALICPSVDAHLRMLTPTNPAMHSNKIPRVIFLCSLIRCILINASQTIHQINAVLERVSRIANIRRIITDILNIACLFAPKKFLIEVIFCLKSNIIMGKNAMRKYP